MSQVDKVLELLDNALQRVAGPCRGDDEPIDRDLCWRCQEAPPGEGSSGACDYCRAVLLGDIEDDRPLPPPAHLGRPEQGGLLIYDEQAGEWQQPDGGHAYHFSWPSETTWEVSHVPTLPSGGNPRDVEAVRREMLRQMAAGLDLPATFFDGDVVRCALYTTPPRLTPERVAEMYAEASGYDPWPNPWALPSSTGITVTVSGPLVFTWPQWASCSFLNGQWPDESQPRPWKRHTPGRFRQRRRR